MRLAHLHIRVRLLCIAGEIFNRNLFHLENVSNNFKNVFFPFCSMSFSLGTDRSSIFVTLCILVQQLRLEKKVDVCTVVRKLRTQRSQFLSTYVSTQSECGVEEIFNFKNCFFSLDFRLNMNLFVEL